MSRAVATAFVALLLAGLTVPPAGLLAREQASAPDPSPTRRIALTFDDLPLNSTDNRLEVVRSVNDRLLSQLAAAGAPAIGFVNESKLYVGGELDGARVGVLESWLDRGQALGNHGFSHLDLHRVDTGAYVADLLEGERVLRRLLAERGRQPRFFRHPFLHTGRSLEVKRQVDQALAEHGYRVAPVTMDNGEYLYARAFDRALDAGDRTLVARIEQEYVAYMERVFEYYEAQSRALLGYELPQVLLLHANRLNARRLGSLLDLLRGRGYELTTLERALEDPAYRRPDTFTGAGGITWLHRWALAEGRRGEFFAGEPLVPDWVEQSASASASDR